MATTLAQRIAEAEDALHRLITGGQAIEVRTDAGTVRYQPSDEARLRTYIRELKAEAGQVTRRRAIRVAFR